MWIVAKIKAKEVNMFKKSLIEKIGKNVEFYYPKVIYKKYFGKKLSNHEQPILENYIFCFHKDFNQNRFLENMKFLKGLNYFLIGNYFNQKNIKSFIFNCKSFENKDGYLLPSFFNNILKQKGQFISGPFKNHIFEIIQKQKNILKVQIGNITASISKDNYLYKPI